MGLDHLSRMASILWNNGGRFWSLGYYLASIALLHKRDIARALSSVEPFWGHHLVRTLNEMSPLWALVPVTVLIVIAFYREILALDRRLASKLDLSLQPKERCLITTKINVDGREAVARLVRFRVANRSSILIKGCRAYLVDVRREGAADGASIDYGDSLQLSWSTRGEAEHVDLPGNVPHYVDVLRAADDGAGLGILRDEVPYRYRDLFRQPGVYHLTVAVSAESVPTETFEFLVDWLGRWDGLDIRTPEPPARKDERFAFRLRPKRA